MADGRQKVLPLPLENAAGRCFSSVLKRVTAAHLLRSQHEKATRTFCVSLYEAAPILGSQLQGLKAAEAREARVGSGCPGNIVLTFQRERCRFLRAAEESEFRTHGRFRC